MELFLFILQWALKTNQAHETAFFFIHLVGLEDFVRAFCVRKQTWQLLVKIKSDPFVNKQPGVEHEREFWGERWLTVFDW